MCILNEYRLIPRPSHFPVSDEEDLIEGDIKPTMEQKALLQSADATIETWNRAARKWQQDHIPYYSGSKSMYVTDYHT